MENGKKTTGVKGKVGGQEIDIKGVENSLGKFGRTVSGQREDTEDG